jgi:hypothetical protein
MASGARVVPFRLRLEERRNTVYASENANLLQGSFEFADKKVQTVFVSRHLSVQPTTNVCVRMIHFSK